MAEPTAPDAQQPPSTGAAAAPERSGTPTPGEPARRRDHNAEWDADEDERPDGDPADVKDAGPLESLGRAVSSPVREAAGDRTPGDRSAKKP